MSRSIRKRAAVVVGLLGLALCLATSVSAATDPFDFVPGTAVLADNFGTGGNGGNTSSTTSATNIFSPTVSVDRYPFTSNVVVGNKTLTCAPAAPCTPDISYVSGPNGFVFPHYSP